MNKVQILRNRLEQEKGRENQVKSNIQTLSDRIRDTKRTLVRHEQAREIVREVGLRTQQQLQVYISDITTVASEAVFDDPYELVMEFVQRRNKTECDLYFQRNDMRADPITASGGGAVDVAAFALRIAAWSMQIPKKRNVIILDEPLRFLSRNLQERASQMIKELSDKLGLQFIIITHEETLAEYADKTFEVSIRKGISKVKEERYA
jgi:DNA repair exonuclease SbcCD ATPase subunit